MSGQQEQVAAILFGAVDDETFEAVMGALADDDPEWTAMKERFGRLHSVAPKYDWHDSECSSRYETIIDGSPLRECDCLIPQLVAAEVRKARSLDVLRLARAIEVHMTGKWYDPVYKTDFEWAESLAALYADLPDEHEERGSR